MKLGTLELERIEKGNYLRRLSFEAALAIAKEVDLVEEFKDSGAWLVDGRYDCPALPRQLAQQLDALQTRRTVKATAKKEQTTNVTNKKNFPEKYRNYGLGHQQLNRDQTRIMWVGVGVEPSSISG